MPSIKKGPSFKHEPYSFGCPNKARTWKISGGKEIITVRQLVKKIFDNQYFSQIALKKIK